MASPQPTDSHTRISNELYTEILMRDFTKRQRAILDLIIRLSYGCGKKTAYIPTLKYFDVCGVHQKKATSELRALKDLNVISWDNLTKLYWFNKDYDTWLIHHTSEMSKERFNELLKLNLQYHQNGGEYPQNGDVYPQNRDIDIPKTVVNSPPKRGQEIPETACPARADEVSITNDNYKDIKDNDLPLFDVIDSTNSTTSDENKNVKKQNEKLSMETQFNALWELYPKKDARKAALSRYIAQRRKGVSHETLLFATENYARKIKGVEKQYIMQGKTFFGPNDRYTDFLDEDKPESAKAEPVKQVIDSDALIKKIEEQKRAEMEAWTTCQRTI